MWTTKPNSAPKSFSSATPASALWPKRKLPPSCRPRRPRASTRMLAHKLAGRQRGQRRIEGQHDHCVDAGESQQAQTLVERREQARGLGRAQKLLRMGFEGDGDGLRAQRTRLGRHRGENLAGGPDARRRSCRWRPRWGRSRRESPRPSERRWGCDEREPRCRSSRVHGSRFTGRLRPS